MLLVMGSVSTRQRNGRTFYVARISRGGKQKSKTFDRHKDARDWVATMEGSQVDPARQVTHAAVKSWIEEAETDGTRAGRVHLHQNLGQLAYKRLSDITSADIVQWRHELSTGREWAGGKPLSHSTIRTLTQILSALFNREHAQGRLVRNPVKGASKKMAGTHKRVLPMQIWTTDTVNQLVSTGDDPLKTMMIVAATSGLRPGELGGLRLSNIDFVAGNIHVVEQANGLYSTHDWRPLKSAESERVVPIPESTERAVERYLEASNHDRNPRLALFRTKNGGMWSSAHLSRVFGPVREAVGVTGGWHKFRHFYASTLIASGASVKVVQKRLGHASPSVTLGVYTHLFPEDEAGTRATFEGLVG